MIFALLKVKYIVMKKLSVIIAILMVISSCATTNEAKLSRIELRKEKKLAQQEDVKKAVESKRFVVKLDRIFFTHGGFANLIPGANYFIVDGGRAIFRAAYIGRQYEIRPIAGINVMGKPQDYEIKTDSAKGMYDIKMKLSRGGDSFNIYLTIGKNGSCNVSLSSMKIDYVSYKGQVVPIIDETKNPSEETIMI